MNLLTEPKIVDGLDYTLKFHGDVDVEVLVEAWLYTKLVGQRWEVIDALNCNRAKYCQTSNIKRTLGGNKIVVHSEKAGESPVRFARTTSSFSI